MIPAGIRLRRSSALRWLRWIIRAGAGATLLLAVMGFVRFPQITGSPLPYFGLSAMLVAAVVAVGVIVLVALSSLTSVMELARRYTLVSGVLLGTLWMAWILYTHLALPDVAKPTIGFDLTIWTLAFTGVVMLLVGLFAAWRTHRLGPALAAGLGSGALTGLLALLTVVVLLDASMAFLVQHMNAGELRDFARSGWANRQAWYYWNEELPGSLGYFEFLSGGGLALGALGGLAGRLLNRLWPSRRT